MVGKLGHERKPEAACLPLAKAVWCLESTRSLHLDLQAFGVKNDLHFHLALYRRMLDGVGHRLGAGDSDIEHTLFRKARLVSYFG